MSLKMTRILTLSIVTIALAYTVSSRSISSPGVCLSDLECPKPFFCNDIIPSQPTRCERRLPGNATCTENGLKECELGYACYSNNLDSFEEPRCVRRRSLGDKCITYNAFSCKASLHCSSERNSTCQQYSLGYAGKPCRGLAQCRPNRDFFCNTYKGVCEPGRPGGKCNVQDDVVKCAGFCASMGFEDGICLSARKEGELCTEDKQCDNSFIPRVEFQREPLADPLVCNNPQGTTGRCVRKSSLLTLLGAKCNPDYDLCDWRRSLTCLATDRHGHVCQHRGSEYSFCRPRSGLSRCLWEDVKLECRLTDLKPSLQLLADPSPFFACRRQSEKVTRGGVCITEYASCERGTECRQVPGVLPEYTSSKYLPPRAAFCVRVVPRGASCGDDKDKFTTQCGDGLRCEKGTCVKTMNPDAPFDITTITHAGLRAACADLPCVPGLVCERERPDSEKLCLLPLKVVGKGVACVDRAVERRRCADGLVCAFRKDGKNVKRCRSPRKAGDYCQRSNECEGSLLCPSVWTPSREREDRRCYDPKKMLRLGQECDPKASGSLARCVANKRPDFYEPTETDLDPMRCMRKGDGFACRVVRQLFELCDETKDVTCESGLHCSQFGACVPVGET